MIRQIAAIAAAALLAGPALAGQKIVDGGFEANLVNTVIADLGVVPPFTGTGYVYPQASVGAWNYPAGSGLINGTTATPWFGGSPPAGFGGAQYAFVQGTGTLSQTFRGSTGLLQVSWLEASRPAFGCCNGDQSYNVLLNGNVLGTFSTASGQAFTQRSLAPVAITAGQTYTLSFVGLSNADNTVFIDNVSAMVPEPASWAMLITGFGGIGLALRRRRALATA